MNIEFVFEREKNYEIKKELAEIFHFQSQSTSKLSPGHRSIFDVDGPGRPGDTTSEMIEKIPDIEINDHIAKVR